MKLLISLLVFYSGTAAATTGISGRVWASSACAAKVMVWLSLDADSRSGRQLLLHTEVPVGGSYKFYTKAGKYQIRASDKSGCEFFTRLEVGEKEITQHVKMVRK